jgi:hypothetical protein
VFLGSDPKRVMERVSAIYPEYSSSQISLEILEDVLGYTYMAENGSIVVYIKLSEISNFGILAHEAFHVVEFVMEFAGVEHCSQSSEAFAYLLTYIVNEITK